MAAIGTPSSDASELLQKLSLDSQSKSLDVHETEKNFGSYASRTINSLAKPYERSDMSLQDYNTLSMYYPTGSYPYYYGGYDDLSLWNDYSYLNHDGVDMHSHRQMNTRMSQAGGFAGRSHLNDHMHVHYGNNYRGGSGFGLNYYNPKPWNNWRTVDNKYPTKGSGNGYFGYGNESKDTLNELSKGPRAMAVKSQLNFASVKLAGKGQGLSVKLDTNEEKLSLVSENEQYNKDNLPENFKDARFFVIKSYSEDDIHKSIKYSVWASTPNGNKKLDAVYQEAKGKPVGCPVFLLFSVNASGQFVGLAEMVGRVDFDKSMDYWQQDKWTGCFPVKWHMVKDVPNNLLKHITLENNDNKPVTISRDTQEVELGQGVQVLNIFKSHQSKTSVLDDFEFYEAREKSLLEKKAKKQRFQKQLKNNGTGVEKLMKSLNADDAAAAFIEGSSTATISAAEKSCSTDEIASVC